MTTKSQMCAERLLCVVPKLMQTLREKMRAGRAAELTVPQFRSLVFFHNHPGAALSQASEHLGLALPSTSKLVETMVVRGYLTRADSTEDRRRLVIGLTNSGAAVLAAARSAAVAAFTRRLDALSATELEVLFAVLGSLQGLIGAEDLDPQTESALCPAGPATA